MTAIDGRKRRENRIAQANHRGSTRSVKTELEDTLLILAWEAEQLSEGQVASLLGIDRVTLRRMREAAISAGLRTYELLDGGRTLRRLMEEAMARARQAQEASGVDAGAAVAQPSDAAK
jgi:hypothetical protein